MNKRGRKQKLDNKVPPNLVGNQKNTNFNDDEEDEQELEEKLRDIMHGISRNEAVSIEDNESLESLLEESERIMDELVKQTARDMEDVESTIKPKRQEMEGLVTRSLHDQLQAVEDHRNQSLAGISQSLTGFKDIRERLNGLLQDIDTDLTTLKSVSDKDLARELDIARNQEAELLRKELLDAEQEESRTTSDYTGGSKRQRVAQGRK